MKSASTFRYRQFNRSRVSVSKMLIMGLSLLLLSAYASLSSAQLKVSAAYSVPFVDAETLDSSIPTPSSVIGHEVGEKGVRYDPLMRYLEALAASSDRIIMKPFGETHEGRTLYHLYITSPENHAKLEQIKLNNGKLADPRLLKNEAAGRKLIETHPATAFMVYGIHGDEMSSCDAAMQLAYQLVAGTDEATKSLLDEVVVVIDPMQNPDGRERHLASIEQRTGVISGYDDQHIQHSAMGGRTNHYRFDMNRDWVYLVTKENQARMRVVTDWKPHFLVDSHEMGAEEGYLMDPPRQPLTPKFSNKNLYWREKYGFEQAAAFDERGWSYYAKDWNVEFAPVYTASWTNLSGGAGLLYEQAAVAGSSYKLPTGHILTYREAVHHHLVSSLANLYTLKNHRKEVLTDYFNDHLAAVNGDDELTGTFLMPPNPDRARMDRFVDLLERHAIEYGFALEPVKGTNATDMWGNNTSSVNLPVGTLVVKSDQPFRRMAHTLLAFETRPNNDYLKIEREELEKTGDSRFYDVTAWNLPMAFGLDSYWVDNAANVKLGTTAPAHEASTIDWSQKPKYGYLIEFSSASVYDVLVRLFEQDYHVRAATKPFVLNGHNFQPGTLLIRAHENPDNAGETLQALAKEFEVNIYAAQSASVGKVGPDLGGPKFILLRAPRVALSATRMNGGVGAVWHLLDYRLNMRVSPSDNMWDLRKYNVLIHAGNGTVSESVKKWIAEGGTLIAFGGPVNSIAKEGSEISSVRRRRDVLDKLALYQEDLEEVQSADDIEIDFADLWGDEPSKKSKDDTKDSKEDTKKSLPSGKIEELKRADEWQRRFSPSGVFVKASIDERQWLGFGLGEHLPVMVSGSNVMMSMRPTATPVRLADEDDLRMSGLLWPEARGRLANSSFATVESYGRGQVILFATNPTYRGWYPGMERLFLNAVLLGPGMGASQENPW